jgi:hypothetical protein
MASTNTKTSLDAMFKDHVAPSVNALVPKHSIVQKMMGPLKAADHVQRQFLWPVALTNENGVTYGDGTAFSYNDDVAGTYGEAQINSYPIVLKSRVSLSAANAMAIDKGTFITRMSLRAGIMKDSLMKRLEIECLYGKSGLGTISGNPVVNTTPTPDQATIIFTDASWAPGIWGGMEGCLLECRNGSTLVNANGDLTLVSVDVDNKSIVVSGDNTDLTDLADGYKIFFKGQYSNGFYGIDAQLTNTGTLFNISAATYNLWKASSFAVGGALTMGKVLKASAKAVAKGGLAEDSILLVSPLTYEGLNTDMAALRQFDSSYNGSKGENGVEGIVFRGQSGKITVISHPYMKEGEAFFGPERGFRKIGNADLNFGMGGDDYFEKLEGSAGYQLLAQADWCIFLEKPATWVKLTGITNA